MLKKVCVLLMVLCVAGSAWSKEPELYLDESGVLNYHVMHSDGIDLLLALNVPHGELNAFATHRRAVWLDVSIDIVSHRPPEQTLSRLKLALEAGSSSTRSGCGGARSSFDAAVADLVLAYSVGASDEVISSLTSAVMARFFEWYVCILQ